MTVIEDMDFAGRVDATAVAERMAAVGNMEALKASGAFDELMGQIDRGEIDLDGKDGFIQQLIRAGLERGLKAELTEHLGYEKHGHAGRMSVNARNGAYPKTVSTSAGDVSLSIPRDRAGSFVPRLVPKGVRHTGQLAEMIVSLYAGGMTVRDIEYHLASTIGTELSRETISKITDEVLDEVITWQNRPLDPIYPIMYLDAIVVKVRDGSHVKNKAAHIAVGVGMDGIKHVLGIWIAQAEGAKFWAQVCSELANRGVQDVLIVCCDGLTGFPEAIEATWPYATVQTCVVHLIRSALRFVSYTDRKKVAAQLREIYTAPNEDAALAVFEDFAQGPWGIKYPAAVKTWESAWERFIPFLAFPQALRKVIYTTNAIESLNFQLRKVTKNRGHFPNDTAVVKLLWLAICNIEDKRARERAKAHKSTRATGGRLLEGATTTGWNHALQYLMLTYPERLENHLD